MAPIVSEYLPILIFFGIAVSLAIIMVTASFVIAKQNPNDDKLSPYECGFDAFEDTRMQFDVRFYLVAILFIIFDLEVAFLFPWAITLGISGIFGFISMMIFLLVLTISNLLFVSSDFVPIPLMFFNSLDRLHKDTSLKVFTSW